MLTNRLQELNTHKAKIAVIGLGYVGLPLAVEFAKKYKVIGLDIKQARVDELKAGKDTTREVEAAELQAVADNLELTSNPEDIAQANVYIITVPTPIDDYRRPDLRPLQSASKTVGKALKPGDIVIYESTVYPGCTEEDCVPILEAESGLTYAKNVGRGRTPETPGKAAGEPTPDPGPRTPDPRPRTHRPRTTVSSPATPPNASTRATNSTA